MDNDKRQNNTYSFSMLEVAVMEFSYKVALYKKKRNSSRLIGDKSRDWNKLMSWDRLLAMIKRGVSKFL